MYCRSTHHRPTHSRGHPSPQPHRHWLFCDLHGILGVVAIPRPMGSLKTFRGGRTRCSRETTPDCGENSALGLAMGRSTRAGVFYCHYWPRVASLLDWEGHHATTPRPHRCHQWHRHARSTESANDPPQCRPTADSFFPRHQPCVVTSIHGHSR